MRALIPTTVAVLLAGCGGGAQRTAAPSDEPARLACDRLAARAIQVADAVQASNLAARASSCYRDLLGESG